MFENYRIFLKRFYNNSQELTQFCDDHHVDSQLFLCSIGPDFLLRKAVKLVSRRKSIDFRELLQCLEDYCSSLLCSQAKEGASRRILSQYWPELVGDCEEDEFRMKVKIVKDNLLLDVHDCSIFIGVAQQRMFESGNRLQSQLIGACLEVFQTVESKICYTKHVLRALRISVGPLLYLLIGFDVLDLKKLGQMYADILERARVCLQLCLDRIKKKEQMLIMLLQELLEPISNDSPTAVQCNLLMFAVLVDIWSTFECENSNLHCKAVNQVVSVAFHRIFYHLYSSPERALLLLRLVTLSKYVFDAETTSLILPHLLTESEILAKQKLQSFDQVIVEFVQTKLSGDLSVQLIYKDVGLLLLSNRKIQQWKWISGEEQTESQSGSKVPCIRMKWWNNKIQRQMARANFQRVYLLLRAAMCDWLRLVKEDETGEQGGCNEIIMNIIVSLIKWCSEKAKHRLGCQFLIHEIMTECCSLMGRSFSDQFRLLRADPKVTAFSSFLFRQGIFQTEKLVQHFHQHNAENSLTVLYHLKVLRQRCNKLNRNELLDSLYTNRVHTDNFQSKVYDLYHITFSNECVSMRDTKNSHQQRSSKREMCDKQTKEGKSAHGSLSDQKDLPIIFYLLNLRSESITNNLFANAVCGIFSVHEPARQGVDLRKEILRDLIVDQLVRKRGANLERTQMLLQLGEIIDRLTDQQAEIGLAPQSVLEGCSRMPSERYFQFLSSQKNAEHFKAFSKAYARSNYLKEALYFLQSYGYKYPNKRRQLASDTLGLYSRLSPQFSRAMATSSQRMLTKINSRCSCLDLHNTTADTEQALYLPLQKEYVLPEMPFRDNFFLLQLERIRNLGYTVRLAVHLQSGNQPLVKLPPLDLSGAHGSIETFLNRLATLSENLQIRNQYLHCSILISYYQYQASSPQQAVQLRQQMVNKAELLQDTEQKIVFYELLHTRFGKDEWLKRLYWQALFQHKKLDKLYDVLLKDKGNKHYEELNGQTLKYFLKFYFETKDYLRVLVLATKIKEKMAGELKEQEGKDKWVEGKVRKIGELKLGTQLQTKQPDRVLKQVKYSKDQRQGSHKSSKQKQEWQDSAEMQHMEMEALCQQRLNFKVQDILQFINEKCQQFHRYGAEPERAEQYVHFYLKMFRLLFNCYTFTREEQNGLFLKTFRAQMSVVRLVDSSGHSLQIQCSFYLLRFLIEKFHYAESQINNDSQQKGSYADEIIQNYEAAWLVPHCNYLIGKIGEHARKNALIQSLLMFIITSDPRSCVWIIAFLKNFRLAEKADKTKTTRNSMGMEEGIARISDRINKQLQIMKVVLEERIQWIWKLIKLSASTGTPEGKVIAKEMAVKPVPADLPYVFDQNYFVHSVVDIEQAETGKSRPVFLTLRLRKTGEASQGQPLLRSVRMVLKLNPETTRGTHYRMQCSTANFFAESRILDKDVTYQIQHLSRCTTIIEYVKNVGTLLQAIQQLGTNLHEVEQEIFFEKRGNVHKLLGRYDKHEAAVQTALSKLIYLRPTSPKQWWMYLQNFTRTAAQWSYLGFIIGLGDRHVQNILVNDQAKLIHIDFQYNLDQGLKLRVPEWVPFRLTKSLVEPMGILGEYGLFFAEMLATAESLQHKEPTIWKALSNFQGFTDMNITSAILQRAVFHRKISLADGILNLIEQATDPEILRQMFDGWKPHL